MSPVRVCVRLRTGAGVRRATRRNTSAHLISTVSYSGPGLEEELSQGEAWVGCEGAGFEESPGPLQGRLGEELGGKNQETDGAKHPRWAAQTVKGHLIKSVASPAFHPSPV